MDPTRPQVSKSQMSCAACRLHGYITSVVVDFSGLSDNNLRSEPSPDLEALLVEPGACETVTHLGRTVPWPIRLFVQGIDQCLLSTRSSQYLCSVIGFAVNSPAHAASSHALTIFLGIEHRPYIVYTKASMFILVVETGSWFMFSCMGLGLKTDAFWR